MALQLWLLLQSMCSFAEVLQQSYLWTFIVQHLCMTANHILLSFLCIHIAQWLHIAVKCYNTYFTMNIDCYGTSHSGSPLLLLASTLAMNKLFTSLRVHLTRVRIIHSKYLVVSCRLHLSS